MLAARVAADEDPLAARRRRASRLVVRAADLDVADARVVCRRTRARSSSNRLRACVDLLGRRVLRGGLNSGGGGAGRFDGFGPVVAAPAGPRTGCGIVTATQCSPAVTRMRNSSVLPEKSCRSSENDALRRRVERLARDLLAVDPERDRDRLGAGRTRRRRATTRNEVLGRPPGSGAWRAARWAGSGPCASYSSRRRSCARRSCRAPAFSRTSVGFSRLGAEERRARDPLGGAAGTSPSAPATATARRRCCRSRSRCRPAGTRRPGVRSTPSRSRTVLLYSVRFSRRVVTRPGSGAAVRSRDRSRGSIHASRRERLRVGPRLVFRRHLAGPELEQHFIPRVRRRGDRVDGLELFEIQAASLAPLAMAGNAGIFEKRLDGRFEPRRVRRIGRRLPRWRRADERQGEKREIDDEPRQRANPSNERRSAEL